VYKREMAYSFGRTMLNAMCLERVRESYGLKGEGTYVNSNGRASSTAALMTTMRVGGRALCHVVLMRRSINWAVLFGLLERVGRNEGKTYDWIEDFFDWR